MDVPLGRLVVVCGLSGSGKVSLAFDTLFAEGQRRYMETFSPYARQFLDRMDKPQAESIEGIPPAIAIEQRNSVKSTRSTVGTMTEITDYAKSFWPTISTLHCRQCGQPVTREPPRKIWDALRAQAPEAPVTLTFRLPLSANFSLAESLALVARQGYRRLWDEGAPLTLEEAQSKWNAAPPDALTVVQDRLSLTEVNRARFVEACEQAYHFGKGRLAALLPSAGAEKGIDTRWFSSGLHCAACDVAYREPSHALFSFNHPLGACPTCRGFGRTIGIDYDAAIPDRSKTLAGGAVRPWQTATGAECQQDMAKFAKRRRVPMDTPFRELSAEHQRLGNGRRRGLRLRQGPSMAPSLVRVKGYFRWLESKAYKMHVRVLLSRYRRYETCSDCGGTRFQPETLLYKWLPPGGGPAMTLADFYRMPIRARCNGWRRSSPGEGTPGIPIRPRSRWGRPARAWATLWNRALATSRWIG